jgi:hypothetical protein
MTGKFEYSLLQYVHHQLWGEVFNLGILFYFPESKEIEFQAGIRWKKLGAIYPDFNTKQLGEVLKAFKAQASLLSYRHDFEGNLSEVISKYFIVRESASLQFADSKSGWITNGSPNLTKENYLQLYLGLAPKVKKPKSPIFNTDHKVADYFFNKLKQQGIFPSFRQSHPEELSFGYATLAADLVWQNGSLNYTKGLALALDNPRHAKDKALILQAQLNHLELLAVDRNLRFDLLVSYPENQNEKHFEDIPKILEDIKSPKKLITVDKIEEYILELEPYMV